MRLTNPQAGLAFDLEGADSHELVMPPPPGFRSKEIIAEIAENYWMGIARDVPFLQYGQKHGPDRGRRREPLGLRRSSKAPRRGTR